MANFDVATKLSSSVVEAVSNAAHVVGRPIIRVNSADFHFPDETLLLSMSFANLAVKSVRLVRSTPAADEILTPTDGVVYVTSGLRLIDIARVYITSDVEQAVSATVTLDLSYLTRRFSSPVIGVEWPAKKGEQQILELQSDRQDRRKELVAHLNANRLYYSNVIHRALDSGTIVAMLAEYTWNGKPLIDQVEPRPITMAGNYLVFRAPVDPVEPSGVTEQGKAKSWGDLLEDRAIKVGKQSADERLIPLPTAGVFAEAVLGRSNAAEKLDITRFWNWQDSPIPLTPTEIAPVGTGSRAMAEDLKPGQLGQPVLNIVNPTSLPAPAGLGAVLGAVSTPNLFRDMSGLAGTQGLVKTGMEETLQAATDAGQLASANMRTEAQKSVAMAQVAADIVKSVMGGGAGGSSAVQGISGTGATINHGKSLDQRAGGTTSDGGGSSRTTSGGPEFTGSTAGNEQAAFNRAVWGPTGASGVEAASDAVAGSTGGTSKPMLAFSWQDVESVFTYSKTASGRPDAEAWGDAWLSFCKKNDHLSKDEQQRIRSGGMSVADSRGLPDLTFALFYYYSSHKILKMSASEEDNARKQDRYAETQPGSDTKVRKDLLDGTMPQSTLGTLLFHELAHTGHHTNVAGSADIEEGHAYGVEYFLAKRAGNAERATKIEAVMSSGTVVRPAQKADLQMLFKLTYATLIGLAEYVDRVGSPRIPASFGLDVDACHILINELVTEFASPSDRLQKITKWVSDNLAKFPQAI